MRFLSTLLFILWATTAPAASAAPQGQVILLGARWCAPCMAEYRELAKLAAVAAPDKVLLAWVDRPMPVPAPLANQVGILSPTQAYALAEKLGGEGFGLPMAVYMRDGAYCRVWKKPLTPEGLAPLRHDC